MICFPQDIAFWAQNLNKQLFNTSTLRRRNFDGQIASMNQSGSHWLKYMLSLVLAEIYDLQEPSHIQDDSIVGHPKNPPVYKFIPKIVHSHSIPHRFLISSGVSCFFKKPSYVILVRDPRASLISQYERFYKGTADFSFDEFLRCHPHDGRFASNIWTRITFMNLWGEMVEKHSDFTLRVRYEDFQSKTFSNLKKVTQFLFHDMSITDNVLKKAVDMASRDKMAQNQNPEVKTTVVRKKARKTLDEYFTPENEKYLRKICRQNLKYDWGYDLT